MPPIAPAPRMPIRTIARRVSRNSERKASLCTAHQDEVVLSRAIELLMTRIGVREGAGLYSRQHQREYPMPVKRCCPHWSLQRRLAERSVRDPKTGCLLWTASRNANGYGHVFWRNAPQLAHRAAWVARHGPIPKGLLVCHRCDVRTCINPDHLFLGTQKDNMADRTAKLGHQPRAQEGPERRPDKAPEIL